ncbi:PaaX family transcriptional regulator C-terminal domain-containing protein [Catenuloplanes sp. NPDC051500]|uniref:PaaX family transcriptional regulator n=1 Tax=Catenuloplanes sp. NPDC051500 TaxID=3363959 RepID=UPI0037A48B0E
MPPLDLAELLPGYDATVARLPRAQNGLAPQGLTVTLLADYTLRTRARLPSAVIVALLAEAGVTPGGARAAISRLARRGMIEGTRQGRHTSYGLTAPAAAALTVGGRAVVGLTVKAESWDGLWTLIAFSLPQAGDAARRSLRGRLRWLGYAPLYDGLWISPHGHPEHDLAAVEGIGRGALTVFRARSLAPAGHLGRDPLQAWDLAGIGDRYEAFVTRWSPLLPRVRDGAVTGAEALRERTAVMETYRRFLMLDPRLPTRMMPAGWPRDRARDVFAAIYDGLAAPALAHVLAVSTRAGGGVVGGVSVHTVAELLTGDTV